MTETKDSDEDECALCGHSHIRGEHWEHLARLENRRADRWREMAETVWEELQEWHHDSCPTSAPGEGCTCHQVIATLMDELSQ